MSLEDDDAAFNKPATESQFREEIPPGSFGKTASQMSTAERMARELANCKRTLKKARDALQKCDAYFEHQATMNATAHCSDSVMRTPLHSKVQGALVGISMYDQTYGLEYGDLDA